MSGKEEFHSILNEVGEPTIYRTYLVRAASYGIRVPAWVPFELIAEYVDCAKEYGTKRADEHIEKIMKDEDYE